VSIIRRMRPHGETISVGGTHVHTWVGGQGDPLLVLHGAGGNRGFTRSMRRLAERYTVWAPTHPGFGRSGDAEWMDGIDDLARFPVVQKAELRAAQAAAPPLGDYLCIEPAEVARIHGTSGTTGRRRIAEAHARILWGAGHPALRSGDVPAPPLRHRGHARVHSPRADLPAHDPAGLG